MNNKPNRIDLFLGCREKRIRANRASGDSRRRSPRNVCVFLLLSSSFAFFVQRGLAQGIHSSTPVPAYRSELHDPDGLSRFHEPDQLNGIGDPKNLNRHLSATGKPCIALEPYATAHLTNKNIYEHWIKASNNCGQNIKVQVCYYHSDDCILIEVPPWETKNAVLGFQPNMKGFQYDAKEK